MILLTWSCDLPQNEQVGTTRATSARVRPGFAPPFTPRSPAPPPRPVRPTSPGSERSWPALGGGSGGRKELVEFLGRKDRDAEPDSQGDRVRRSAVNQGRRDFSQGMDAPIYTAPKFETGDDRYAWLNKIQAVAKGIVDGSTLT